MYNLDLKELNKQLYKYNYLIPVTSQVGHEGNFSQHT